LQIRHHALATSATSISTSTAPTTTISFRELSIFLLRVNSCFTFPIPDTRGCAMQARFTSHRLQVSVASTPVRRVEYISAYRRLAQTRLATLGGYWGRYHQPIDNIVRILFLSAGSLVPRIDHSGQQRLGIIRVRASVPRIVFFGPAAPPNYSNVGFGPSNRHRANSVSELFECGLRSLESSSSG
jgi:hypothetical protein